jgi:peroxiredoxin
MTDPQRLPPDLPVPPDDGACRHLPGLRMPALALPGTAGGMVDLGRATPAWTVLYCFPRASQPDAQPPSDWDRIPGARGCTAQACDFRDHHQRLVALDAVVFGISTQTPAAQREVAARLRLPFELLSDESFPLTGALGLPTFTAGGLRLLRRLTLVVRHGVIETVFYPIFPPDRSTAPVIDWLASRQTG